MNKEIYIDKFLINEMTGADIKHIVNQAHINSWIRCGVFDKMKAGTLVKGDMDKVFINSEDFDKAFASIKSKEEKTKRRKIGY